ncbi:Uncharacterised protein [Vibrio cholerae]|nr:Uncharacterised protein [Vibrio cholerae]
MLFWSIFAWPVIDAQQLDIDLQRGVGQEA